MTCVRRRAVLHFHRLGPLTNHSRLRSPDIRWWRPSSQTSRPARAFNNRRILVPSTRTDQLQRRETSLQVRESASASRKATGAIPVFRRPQR